MKTIKQIAFLLACFSVVFLGACDGADDEPGGPTDAFDRAGMLVHWADNIIIPAYNAYVTQLDGLKTSTDNFVADATMDNLISLQSAWANTTFAWQRVSMFEIGPAEAITLRNFTNVFPVDTDEVDGFVASGDYNLQLPSTNDAQGLPALDYLLFGTGADEAAVLAALDNANHKAYLTALVDRLRTMGTSVRDSWTTGGYRDEFVAADGSTATSSVNKLVNDFMFYYEKALRAGKVGIPAGVFSGTPLSDKVEAPFSGELSGEFLVAALGEVQRFFTGANFTTNADGPGLADYLDHLGTERNGENLSDAIGAQLSSALTAIFQLDSDLKNQVEMDNSAMLTAYDELQKAVVMMKVDMFLALNIQVDFVDADGD